MLERHGPRCWREGCHTHLDPRKLAVLRWGHSWVVLAVVVRLPFCPQRVFSLPVLVRLYLNRKASKRWRRTYSKRTDLAVELLHRLCGAHPERSFHALADSAYGGETVLVHLPSNCGLTSRMPLNARLHHPPPVRKPGTNGRPRVRGTRLPTPRQLLKQRGRRCELAIYGRHDRVRLVELVAHWYRVPARPLKVVINVSHPLPIC